MPNHLTQMAVIMAIFGLAGCRLDKVRCSRRAAKPAAGCNEDRRLMEKQIADVQLSLARTLEIQGEIDEAIDAYSKAIEKSPEQATGYWRLAVLNDRRANVQESSRLYRQAIKLDPKNADIHCDYGYSLYLQRRWAEAENELRQALALAPKNRRAHNNFGLLLAQTEWFEEALAEFRQAGCSEDEAHVNLAFISMLNRRWMQARDEFQRALDVNPDSEAARLGRDKLDVLTARANGQRGAEALAADRCDEAGGGPERSTSRVAGAAWAERAPLHPTSSVR